MKFKRIIYLLIVLITLTDIRFIIYPELSKYFDLKANLKTLEQQYKELMEQKEAILALKDKMRDLNSKISRIQNFQLADYFPEIIRMEKKSEHEVCFSQFNCFIQEDVYFETALSFIDLVAFFKEFSQSKELVLFKSIYLESGYKENIKTSISAQVFKKITKQ